MKNSEKNPAHQADESHGKLKKEQLTERNAPTKDLPQGSEPETRGTSRGR